MSSSENAAGVLTICRDGLQAEIWPSLSAVKILMTECDIRRSGRLVKASACLALLFCTFAAGCVIGDERMPVPVDRVSEAHIEQVQLARVWGDRITPEIRAILDSQYGQTKLAAGSGRRSVDSLKTADFLAISGGGADGAYAAGVLFGWSERGDRPQFEVVTGVSTGGLAAPFAFLGSRYDAALKEVFTLYGDSDIYTSLGVIGFASRGLYDSTPLRRLIGRYLTDRMVDEIAAEYRIGRRLLIQTTNIDAQRPVIWDLSAIAASDRPDRKNLMIDVLLASSAIPAVFAPVRIEVRTGGERRQELHVDGGTVAQLFFAPPEIGLDRFERRYFGHVRSRRLFLIRNGRLIPQYGTTPETALGVARRAIDTLVKYQTISDLVRMKHQATLAHARLFYSAIPAQFTAVAGSEFDRDYMRALFEVGRQEGRGGVWRSTPPPTPVLAGVD
jgi:hypothetical protein